MAEQSPLVRQWIISRTLCARHFGAAVGELAVELGVSKKTIRRDLETFQAAGFPLAEVVEKHGRKKWRMDPGKNQPGLSFTLEEVISLYIARHLLEPLAGTPFWDGAQRAFKKVRATLGAEPLRFVERFGQLFYQTTVGTSDYAKKAEIIDQLVLGLDDRRAVLVAYQSLRATEPVSYEIYPYGLAYHRGALYVVGWSPDHQEIRHWKVNRMEHAEVTEFPFQRPETFDLRGHFAGSFGVYHGDGEGEVHVKVRFAPAVARYVSESHWHESQKLTPQKGGGLVAEFDLDGTEEIKRWILGFGRHAEVVEPPGLREELVEETRRMLKGYSQAKADGPPAPTRTQHSEG